MPQKGLCRPDALAQKQMMMRKRKSCDNLSHHFYSTHVVIMPTQHSESSAPLYPILLAVISIGSVQTGASIAKMLFPILSVEGVTALRLFFASIMLSLIFRPWKKRIGRQALPAIILYGLSVSCMNLSYFNAIERIPIGIAVALELTGPLMLAMCLSRQWLDFVWIGLTILGLSLLLPIFDATSQLDPVGILFALLAGACWAMYIIFGKKAGTLHGTSSVALGLIIATLIIFPIGLIREGSHLFSLSILPLALLVAVLSSALPYGLDMVAMPKLPAKTFSILMSLSPTIAAFAAFFFLGENLTLRQWSAIGCIVIASMGTSWAATRRKR